MLLPRPPSILDDAHPAWASIDAHVADIVRYTQFVGIEVRNRGMRRDLFVGRDDPHVKVVAKLVNGAKAFVERGLFDGGLGMMHFHGLNAASAALGNLSALPYDTLKPPSNPGEGNGQSVKAESYLAEDSHGGLKYRVGVTVTITRASADLFVATPILRVTALMPGSGQSAPWVVSPVSVGRGW